MISREGAQVILDPHNNLAVKYMQWVACNSAAGNVVYEDIARTDRVLRWMFLEPSGNKGLEGMRERARLLGGECTIEPREGGGTFVRCWVPWRGSEVAATAPPALNPQMRPGRPL